MTGVQTCALPIYGVEVKANLAVQPAKDWLIDLNGSYSWTPSINEGEKTVSYFGMQGKSIRDGGNSQSV